MQNKVELDELDELQSIYIKMVEDAVSADEDCSPYILNKAIEDLAGGFDRINDLVRYSKERVQAKEERIKMEDKLTHNWLIQKGFHHHTTTGMSLYSKDDFGYVHNNGEPFCLRIRNEIKHKPVDSITDFINLHRIISGNVLS